MKGNKGTTATDMAIGQHIRRARQTARLSQSELGGRVNVTFQQQQKYERGINRICVSRFIEEARTLGTTGWQMLREIEEGLQR